MQSGPEQLSPANSIAGGLQSVRGKGEICSPAIHCLRYIAKERRTYPKTLQTIRESNTSICHHYIRHQLEKIALSYVDSIPLKENLADICTQKSNPSKSLSELHTTNVSYRSSNRGKRVRLLYSVHVTCRADTLS